ncbi:hypothetical protein JCM10207_001249 [Rhodosporidiobolus poonsookiae]
MDNSAASTSAPSAASVAHEAHATATAGPRRAAERSDADSADDYECLICYEQPLTWGILDCCSHSYCYDCITSWQEQTHEGVSVADAEAKNQKFFEDGPDKEEAFATYRAGLANTPCRDFMRSPPERPYCPRGRDCLYSHTHTLTGYKYTFTHTLAEHFASRQRLVEEAQAQQLMVALLQEGSLGLPIPGFFPPMTDGVRAAVDDLVRLVQTGEFAAFRRRLMEMASDEAWVREVSSREWVGEGEVPEGESDWYDEEEEGSEGIEPGAEWATDEEDEVASSADEGVRRRPTWRSSDAVSSGSEDSSDEDEEAEEEDDLPDLEPIDMSSASEAEDDDLPPLEPVDSDGEPLASSLRRRASVASSTTSGLAPLEAIDSSSASSFSSDSDTDSGSDSAAYLSASDREADSDTPLRSSSSSSRAPSPPPAVETWAALGPPASANEAAASAMHHLRGAFSSSSSSSRAGSPFPLAGAGVSSSSAAARRPTPRERPVTTLTSTDSTATRQHQQSQSGVDRLAALYRSAQDLRSSSPYPSSSSSDGDEPDLDSSTDDDLELRPPPSHDRARARQRKRAAEAAERRRTEEKWEEMD